MDQFGNDFDSATGSVMTRKQLEEQRRKRGECITCGRKCFQKKLFKSIPITDHGRVLNGRCLNCHPLKAGSKGAVMPAVSRRATSQDLERFNITQSNLAHVQSGGPSSMTINSGDTVAGGRDRVRSTRAPEVYRRGNSSRSLPGARHAGRRGLDEISISGFESAPSVQSVSSAPVRPDPFHLPVPPAPISSPTLPSSSFRSRLSQDSSHEGQYYSGTDEEPADNDHVPNISDDYPPHFREQEFYAEDYSDSFQDAYDDSYARDDPHARDGGHYSAHDNDQYARDEHFHARDEQHFSSRSDEQYTRDNHYAREQQQQQQQQQAGRGGGHLQAQQSPNALQEYYRRGVHVGGSQTSLRSAESTTSDNNTGQHGYDQEEHAEQDRVLNRGGAFNHQIASPPPCADPSRFTRNNSRGSAERQRPGSSRSVESAVSFEDGGYSQSHLPLHPHQEHGVEQHPHYSNHSEHDESHYDDSQYDTSQYDESHYDDSRTEPAAAEDEIYPADQAIGTSPGLVHLRAARSDFVEILNVMRDYPDDVEVQSAALHNLSEIELSEENNQVLTQIGGINVIVNSMASFPSNLELQICGCRAVWNASGTAQNQHDFVAENALDTILPAMGDFVDDANLQEQAMAALANLAALQVNLETMVEKGAVELVVQSMNKHGDNPQVQMKGCLVVANLSSHPTNLKQTIMKRGGGNALVIAMVIHQDEAELQEKALRGLRNLSANCDENKVELTNIGGIDAVIGAMRVHRDAASVQEAGAWTLSNLGGNADSNALIGDCGGVEVIIRAMWVHTATVSVVEWCCRALFTMTMLARNSALIMEVGGISAVINAMQAHVDDSAVVQEMGCAILCNLAADDHCKMRIVDEEALDAIVLAMVLFSEEGRVQERGCQVLLQLAIPENLRSMQASNATELVRAASQRFPETCGEPAERLLEVIESYIAEYG